MRRRPRSTLFPYTTLFRSDLFGQLGVGVGAGIAGFALEIDGHAVAEAVYFEGEPGRSEEHTSELQSLAYLVCRLLLEKKKSKAADGALADHFADLAFACVE